MKNNKVLVSKQEIYNTEQILKKLPDSVFDLIDPADKVVIKPNWVRHSHLGREGDWEYVITHPTVLTAVFLKVLEKVGQSGEIVICDAPETDTDFKQLISHYPVELWLEKAKEKGVAFRIIDLRDDEWKKNDGVIVERKKLPGDPKGSVEVNLKGEQSEFFNHEKSDRGYYGADFNLSETNMAHDGFNNKYRVSGTVIEADVFVNVPKLKTHKKGGITCCLKNLVGINTYKNFLPHHSEGSPKTKGDQFPKENINSKVEGPVLAFLKQNVLQNTTMAKVFAPVKKIGRAFLGDTEEVIRSGNWFGNDTLWRMVLDLNKVMFYANPNSSFKEDDFVKAKKYIGVVDGIVGGEGNGPLYPDPINAGFLIVGTNPVAIDSACATIIGFDPLKIPSIKNSFNIKKFKIVNFDFETIKIDFEGKDYFLSEFPVDKKVKFRPHFGWINHVES